MTGFPLDELSARLPAPRDDEPAGLRRDIVDELGDHLACAMRRELLTGRGEEGAARRQVIDRFGDPAALVRRLWRDALWEKVMSQRLLIGMWMTTVVAGLAFAGAAWIWIFQAQAAQSQSMEEHRRALDRLVETSRQDAVEYGRRLDALAVKLDRTFVQQQTGLNEPSHANKTSEVSVDAWGTVAFRFVRASESEEPDSDVYATLTPSDTSPSKEALHQKADAGGVVNFNRVPAGSYLAQFHAHSREMNAEAVSVLPGDSLIKTISCLEPVSQPPETRLRIIWPDDLVSQPLSLRVAAHFYRSAGGRIWVCHGSTPGIDLSGRLLFKSDGTIEVEDAAVESQPRPYSRFLNLSLLKSRGIEFVEAIDAVAKPIEMVTLPSKDAFLQRGEIVIQKECPSETSLLTQRKYGPLYREGRYFVVKADDLRIWRPFWNDKGLWLTPPEPTSAKVREAIALIDAEIAEAAERVRRTEISANDSKSP